MKNTIKIISIYVFGFFYIAAGIIHFLKPEFYLRIMPPAIPWHLPLVYLSGLAEIVLGIGLIIPKTRKIAAYGIIALLIAVFPANIYMAMNNGLFNDLNVSISPILTWLRLPLQFVLIGIAYWQRKV